MLGRFYQRSVPPQLQVEGRPFSSPRKAFILRLPDGLFLFAYQSDGVHATGNLQQAKLFFTPPTSASEILHAEICTVLVNADGSGVRRTLLDRADGDGLVPPSFLVRHVLTTQLDDG